jgi:protein-arginine kinase activator protein McsA
VGRQYEAPPPDLLREVTVLGELRDRLHRAIAQEEFEEAAQLRDKIRGME